MLSEEIINARRGSITASAAHRIMAGWDAPEPDRDYPAWLVQLLNTLDKKPLVADMKKHSADVTGKEIDKAWRAIQFDKPSQGLLTYAEELACDELFEHDPMTDFSTVHTENGNEREIACMALLSEATGILFARTGEDQIHINVNGVGCTSDGIVYDDLDLIETGAEAKCRSPLHHARQLFIRDNESLLELDPDRYCQMQVCMFVCGCDRWYSASYNPHAINPLHAFHYCIIERDDRFLDVFNKRAKLVFEHKAAFLKRVESLSELRVAA